MSTNPFTGEVINDTALTVRQPSAPLNKFGDMGFDVAVDMTTAQLQFCSMKANSDEDKEKLFNAMNNPDKRLADCINMDINVKDLYIEIVNCTNEETQEVTACPRIVIIDTDNVSYQCVSVGIYSALKKLVQVFGSPTWHDGIKMKVVQVTKGNRKMLTLKKVS